MGFLNSLDFKSLCLFLNTGLFTMKRSGTMWLLVSVISVVVLTVSSQDTFYFNIKPESKDVVEGSETRLYCDVSDRHLISFMWVQSGRPVTNTSRRFQEDSNLRITRVMRGEDDGPFQCIATNATTGFSLQSQEALLNILWIENQAQVLLKRPKKEEVQEGVDITLKCQVSGNPEPTVLWSHNTYRLQSDRVRVFDSGSRIKILNITGANNGVYSCKAKNMAGMVESVQDFFLNIKSVDTPHLLEDLYRLSVLTQKNQDARLDCPFEGATSIDWFFNYEKLSNASSGADRYVVYPNGSLYFPRVRESDEGTYRCEGWSDVRPAHKSQTFTVELKLASIDEITPSTFEPRLQPRYPIVIPAQQRFEIKVFPPEGKPTPTYKWYNRNDRVVDETGPLHVKDNNLVFESPQEIDSGNYTFEAKNIAGRHRKDVWVIVSVPPIISRVPQPTVAEEESSAQFTCQVSATAYPVTVITWQKDGVPLPMGSDAYRMDSKTGTLDIPSVKLEDEGHYACVANTSGHPVKVSSPAYLRVTKKLKFAEDLKPVYYLELGKEATITCHVQALGEPIIRWMKYGEVGLPSHMYRDKGTLVIEKVQKEDEGRYTCVASHRNQGHINASTVFKIVEKPSFRIRPPSEATAYEGQPVMFHCMATGDPEPKISWVKDGRPIQSGLTTRAGRQQEKYMVFKNGSLLLHKALMEDRGRYGCYANSSAGFARTDFNLSITQPIEEDEGFDMAKTVIIVVCSAGAYLVLVIGLTAFCSYRLLMQRKSRKQLIHNKKSNGAGDFQHHREQHELLMKDRDSGLQFRSDSDNRSHVSGMSSHPSHSSASATSPIPPSSGSGAAALARCRSVSLERFQFPRQDLQTLGIIGKGQFGDVFLAKARAIRPIEPETLVVIKSLLVKGEVTSVEFHNEMEMYAKLEHPNIVRLLGVCRETEPFFMITEYCDWGDLKQFVMASRTDNGRRMMTPRVPPLTSVQKLKMCQQVALGMEYLSGYKFIHRDLAARNVLLTSRLDLKVCSLSLCRDVYANEYFPHPSRQKILVPLRWLPPEAVRDVEYSFHTDIWSYGVLMWEVFHLGDLPYRLHSDDEVFKSLCGSGMPGVFLPRLDFSEQCPSQIVDIVHQCCSVPAASRPSFSDLVVTLGHLLTNGDCV